MFVALIGFPEQRGRANTTPPPRSHSHSHGKALHGMECEGDEVAGGGAVGLQREVSWYAALPPSSEQMSAMLMVKRPQRYAAAR